MDKKYSFRYLLFDSKFYYRYYYIILRICMNNNHVLECYRLKKVKTISKSFLHGFTNWCEGHQRANSMS